MLARLKIWARSLSRDAHAIYLASRDPRVPWHAKVLAVAVAGYALSPIDLIPDFIPVIGYLDDLIILPLGIWLVVSLIPARSWPSAASWRMRPGNVRPAGPGMIFIIVLWLAGAIAWRGPAMPIGPAGRLCAARALTLQPQNVALRPA